MKIECKNNFIAVKAIEQEKVSKSGLILPDKMEDEEQIAQGEVIAHCEPCIEGSYSYKVGDIVLFSKIIPQDFKFKDGDKETQAWFVKESDIICVLK